MPIEASTSQNPRLVGKTISGATCVFGPGATVSLNLARRGFLSTPDRSFFLNAARPTARIPAEISDENLALLRRALDAGQIVVGDTPAERPARRGLFEPIYEQLDKATTVDEVKKTVFSIASGTRRMDGIPPAEILRRLAIHEAENGCRDFMLDFLGSVLTRVPGASGVEEHPQDRERPVLVNREQASVPTVAATEARERTLSKLI